MTCDPDDPRLTAFVLGELEPTEHAAIETMLGESADCRQAVDEIRLTVGWLTSQLHVESEAHSQPGGPNHVALAANSQQLGVRARPWWSTNRAILFGLAASLLLAVSVSLPRPPDSANARAGSEVGGDRAGLQGPLLIRIKLATTDSRGQSNCLHC